MNNPWINQVDWNKMTTDSSSMAEKLKKKLHIKSKSGLEKFQDFAAKNIYVAGGFTGGFFLGIASSWSDYFQITIFI